MRCPDCNKFVSYGERDPEPSPEDLNGNTLTLDVEVMLECADCGCDLKSATLDVEIDLASEHECDPDQAEEYAKTAEARGDGYPDPDEAEGDERWQIDGVSAAFSSRTQTTDRNGKAIKNPRYMKTFYGADVTVECQCKLCGEEFTVETQVDEQASAFEELV